MTLSNKKLILLGTGIKTISHLTSEAQSAIKQADVVLYLVNEPMACEWIIKHSRYAISLEDTYFSQIKRKDSYTRIYEKVIEVLKIHNHVVLALYGHPTIYATSGLMAIKSAEDSGIETSVYPGISAEDCLFADLRIDPSNGGCYSIEATDFILLNKIIDVSNHLIIWQLNMIGSSNLSNTQINQNAIKILLNKLLKLYPQQHQIYLYEAALYPGLKPTIIKFSLHDLIFQQISSISMLYLPPLRKASTDNEVLDQLGIQLEDLS